MNKINPIHIIAFIIVLALFFIFKLSNAKNELSDIKKDYKENLKLATEIDSLANAYNNETKIKIKINSILKHSLLKKSIIKKDVKNSKIILKCEKIDKAGLNYLMGKLLNNSFNITKLKIKNINDKKASLLVEITW